MEKTHYKKLKDPNYIGAYELMNGDGTTNEMVVTIRSANKEELKNAEKNQGLVIGLEGQKPMIVNSINAKSITQACGSPFVEDWIGKNITLYVVKIKAFGEMMEALRVKKEAPKTIEKEDFNKLHEKWSGAVETVKSGKDTLEKVLAYIRKTYNLSDENAKLFTDETKA